MLRTWVPRQLICSFDESKKMRPRKNVRFICVKYATSVALILSALGFQTAHSQSVTYEATGIVDSTSNVITPSAPPSDAFYQPQILYFGTVGQPLTLEFTVDFPSGSILNGNLTNSPAPILDILSVEVGSPSSLSGPFSSATFPGTFSCSTDCGTGVTGLSASTTPYGGLHLGTAFYFSLNTVSQDSFQLYAEDVNYTFPPTFTSLSTTDVSNVTLSIVSSPTPEPSTYTLMFAGLGAVGFAARRRRPRN